MIISTRGRYATRMLLDIALWQGEDYVPMKDIAERQHISKKYMETFTARLSMAGIIAIRRGKNGGYRLLRDPEEVTLLDILKCSESSIHAVACLECEQNNCPRAEYCMTLPVWQGLEKVVSDYLGSITLRQLIDQAKPQPEDLSALPLGD